MELSPSSETAELDVAVENVVNYHTKIQSAI
jgi:hypothetical protein